MFCMKEAIVSKNSFLKCSYEVKIPEKCASDIIFSRCNFVNNSSI